MLQKSIKKYHQRERKKEIITHASIVNTGAHNYRSTSQWRFLCGDKIRHIRRCRISVSDTFLYDIAVRYFIFNRQQYVESGQSAFLSNGVSLRRDVQFPSCNRYRCIQKMSIHMYNGDMYESLRVYVGHDIDIRSLFKKKKIISRPKKI